MQYLPMRLPNDACALSADMRMLTGKDARTHCAAMGSPTLALQPRAEASKKPRTEASRGPAPPDGWKSQRDFVAFLRARGAACTFEAPNPKRERQCAYVASSGTYGPTTYAPTQASAGTIPRQSRGTTAT